MNKQILNRIFNHSGVKANLYDELNSEFGKQALMPVYFFEYNGSNSLPLVLKEYITNSFAYIHLPRIPENQNQSFCFSEEEKLRLMIIYLLICISNIKTLYLLKMVGSKSLNDTVNLMLALIGVMALLEYPEYKWLVLSRLRTSKNNMLFLISNVLGYDSVKKTKRAENLVKDYSEKYKKTLLSIVELSETTEDIIYNLLEVADTQILTRTSYILGMEE